MKQTIKKSTCQLNFGEKVKHSQVTKSQHKEMEYKDKEIGLESPSYAFSHSLWKVL